MAESDPDAKSKQSSQGSCIDIISNYLIKSLRLKSHVWPKCYSTEEYKEVIIGFLKESYQERLIFTLNAAGMLTASHEFPEKTKNKIVYFVRRNMPTTITVENFFRVLLIGDLLPNILDSLSSLLDNVFYPMLSNPDNQTGWTSVIVNEMKSETQNLRNAIVEIKGAMINKTILPMPIEIDEIMKIAPKIAKGDLSGFDFELKHSIESIVINWEQVVRAHVEHRPNTINSENDTYEGPQKLFDTWNSRLENLEFINEQLTDSKVKTIGFILEKVDSVYLRRFRQMNEIALENLLEARDITLYLLPLKKIIDKFDTSDFDECKPLITSLLLNVCLLWANSLYFPTRENMSLLFRMINNALIDNSLKSLDPDSIFQGELEESYLKLKPHIEILQHYKKTYEYLKSQLDNFKKVPNSTAQDWSWNPDLIFSRVDLYLNRLEMLQQAFMTGIEFVRLEKVEIGGIKGRLISAEMQKISEDSTNFYRGLSNIKINPLDITADIKETEKEMLWIKEEIDTLERRVANQFERAFQDCHELNSTIQLIHIGASLLHRELIKPQVIDYILNVAVLFDQELDAVKIIFDEFNSIYKQHGVEGLPVDPYYPKVSGAIHWTRKLKDRILTPQNDFHLLEFPIFQSEFGQYTLDKMNEMLGHLQKFEHTIYDKWVRRVTRQITDGMNKPLLRKENDQLLLNFDIELDTALKDIKNLNYLGYEHTELINKFFEKESHLWDARLQLTRIAEWYNDMHNNIHKSEFALIKKEIEAIDNLLKSSLETVNWNNFKKSNIEKEYKAVNNLHTRLVLTHNHLQAIRDSIRSWGKIPLYDRKDNQAKALFNTDDRIKILEKRFQQCLETINLIAKAMKANLKLFFNLQLTLDDFFPDEEIPIWLLEIAKKEDVKVTENINLNKFMFNLINSQFDKIDPDMISIKSFLEDPIYSGLTPNDRITFHEYQKYVDGVIAEELRTVVIFNIRYILEEIDYRCEKNSPIFEIKMELQEPKIIFIKDIDINNPDGFFYFIIMILDDILNITIMIPKVCQPFSIDSTFPIITKDEETFHKSIEKDPEILRLRHDIVKRTKSALAMVVQHVRQYNEHNYIWTDNKDEYLAEIKKYGRPLTLGEKELDPHNFKVKEQEPTLDIYREQLDKFLELYTEVSEWESFEDFYFWLRLNKKGFKHSVLNQLVRWVNLFRQDLVNRVTNDLDELENFIVEAINVLSTEVDKEDFEGILKIMTMLNKINDRQFKYDFMFEPLKDITELLKVYNYEFSDKVATQFSELPDAWNKVKRQAAATKQLIAPMQAYQVDLIERRIILLDVRMNIFRNKFLDQPFFKAPCDFVYEKLDNMNKELLLLEESYEHLKESAKLFDIPEPDQTKLKRTRREIKMVKELWDFVLAIDSTVDDWKKTLWKRIDIEEIDQECKKFGRELRLLDKDMRSWDPYIHGESILKNLMTSLRAVTELQNPAIRDRHWAELMHKTNVQFRMDDSTTLEDLLALNLHNYEEEVKDIVDKSVKEMAMEKLIHDITHAWKNMEFTTDIHERTGLKLLKISEETIEQLEDHQVQLQNMLSSKYIEHFFDEVTDWQQKLSNADAMITAWFEVQRKWQYLESIFIGSVDIRSQLPGDSKRFDSIDKEFKSMLAQVNADRNIIHATNKPGIVENLEHLANELVLCEKALNDYLETKRLAYPRFYFVSSTDLLDILSHGNKPLLVCKHLTKLYDSLAKLVLIEGTKRAKGMIAKEHDEYVPFNNICDCSGPVEVWLNRVTDKMRETLRDHFRRAVEAYEENPRHVWIFEWPAQPALVTTQIWWTADTNLAFKKLEMGYENAMKDFNKKQISQLNALINLLLGDLSKGDRQKIMTVCTIDVHSRDVVIKLIAQKIEQVNAFQWQSQLRHRWDKDYDDCFANICDAQFRYDYEYLGNTPRLVITPLTDRCYITLTQSLHLVMGGAPAGPAGTGKTETTKDLGRALGMMVYVFNCSEQMDYKSTGNIHKGLAQTGAWGCFDEFNRISVDVLSVVAVQVKSILDAIKSKKEIFNFLGEYIKLRPTVGMFITMNPGYAGRTELPENLKTLYRPCAMVVPDFAMICEIMLVAEGFQDAKLLARKFITLYTLCKELLSKQDHYDWGLRAIKSVLVVAGALRRDDRDRPEDQVLMRALRDFNIPKIVTDDVPVFMGLIGDLFPALDVPRKRDMEFEDMIKKTTIEMKLQPEDGFILKVVQLEELFAVRHSVFIIGNAGTGKSEVWKTLHRTYHNMKKKPFYNDLNPKAVTNDELFGIVNPATREWKDGLFSIIMRDQANMGGDGPKWIVLDGDIDPMWIESLNTVMDDNKVLTLASNERIALTKEMRLLFEIANLKTATPATVSRAGILYINPQDLGWNPYVASWISTRSNESEKSNLLVLFERYIPSLLEVFKTKLKRITPISEIAMIQMTCYLLDVFLTPSNVPPECPREWYEIYFVFAVIWGFGSTLFQDQILDWRNEFSKWWVNEFKSIKFPSGGNLFSFYVDHETKKFLPWKNLVQSFELNPDIPLQASLVPTDETTRLLYFMDILIKRGYPVMLVGPPGSGKSVIMNSKLNLLPDSYAVTNVPFNFYTTSEMLQRVLEKPLEKKAGRNYGPIGNKSMIYFVDDLNMPEVDLYGTVQPHTLIRQFMDYKHWYDRQKMTLREIHKCQFVSCMNPSAGSFTINPRLQRHFCTFAVNAPSTDALFHILSSILQQHLDFPHNKFSKPTKSICESLVNSAIALHQKISSTFLPTAIKFHYNFNLRDIANIFTGIMFANGDCSPNPDALIRLWIHECTRVYGDKLVSYDDLAAFDKTIKDTVKKEFATFNEDVVFEKPNIFCHFAKGLVDPKYMPADNWEVLSKLLNEAQDGYNDLIGAMNLVLFEDAMAHVCRINRILEAPRGYALLIGVGGSGKQSLTRLACFISSLDVFQIQLSRGYGINDMKADLSNLYLKAGIKNNSNCFLLTDSEVAQEEFLVLVNDVLASGEIPELFPDEEIDNIIGGIRNEVKQHGIFDNKENCWKYFIEKVRGMLKIVLCFSPVGSTLRVRARKFPAIINCTTIDWFHEWPKQALESVSQRFLSQIEVLPVALVRPISEFMAFVHGSVNDISQDYLLNDKRYNYTTPKSFLELISLYGKLLTEKVEAGKDRVQKLENGLLKLASCALQVDGLQEVLKEQEVVLKVKNEAADKLIVVVSAENEKVQAERNIAEEEEEKVRAIEEDVSARAAVCEEDLRRAQPLLIAAQEALQTLNKNNLTELKSFGSPPQAVVNVCAAVLVLFSKKGKIPKDRSWKACKILMGKVDQFLHELTNYDKENIPPDVIKALLPYLNDPEFDPDNIRAKSIAAAGLCAWVINIHKFYEVYLVVEPKVRALKNAQDELKAAREKLIFLNNKLNELQAKLNVIQAEYDAAMAEKQKCQDEADKTAFTLDLANRLISGLASEKVRWRESINSIEAGRVQLPGDILLVSCFISYVGCFSRPYRIELMQKLWLPHFKNMEPSIPSTEGADPFHMICDDAQIAEWNNQGLPSDRMSAENAAILTICERYPLMIDPQLQGIRWIKKKYGRQLIVLRLTQKNYLDVIEKAVRRGSTLLLENIEETIDAVLNPLLSRTLIKKGTILKIGDKEIDFNPKFRLILQTKLANPHYKPEMQAQLTLINFTVTRDGLEEQLLARVVKKERLDLEMMRTKLTQQQNTFKITLKQLEDDLLQRLSTAGENILDDPTLVLNLEKTKKTAEEIEIRAKEAKLTSAEIDEARENYRPAAKRASIIYFILNDLFKVNPIYQFSLKAYTVVFSNAMAKADETENLKERIENLIDSITFCSFVYTSRGLFEQDKLIFLFQMTIQILLNAGEMEQSELDFLLKFPYVPGLTSPVPFLTNVSWGAIKALCEFAAFKGFDKDVEMSHKRWESIVQAECPEKEKFPSEWKNKTDLQKLCMMRALRPDRMVYAVQRFIEAKFGTKYIETRTPLFSKTFEETDSNTHVFFILSPGVDPLKDVEKLGRQMGFHDDNDNFHNVSLGQGQEVVAERAMDIASAEGHWVILQNIHLVAKWLSTLEKKIESIQEHVHPDYRLFLSAEPAAEPSAHILPQGILESAIKITNEPPTGMLANIHKALDNFSQETLEQCSKETEFKSILFALCYFHAVVAERRKFGPQGWNRVYPFNFGDLTISVYVLHNYLEANVRVPWEDLRYLFGDIMYGGHITDDWDRRLCRTYLEVFMQPELIDAELFFCPGFQAPENLDYNGYHQYIDDKLPPENPNLYGLHLNAEIGFLSTLSERLFETVLILQPRSAGGSKGTDMSQEDVVRTIIEETLDKVPAPFNIPELMARTEDRSPYTIVAFQECERMNLLMGEIRRSLQELELGLKGELTITSDMEDLMNMLFMDKVPDKWTKLAYPSLLGLQSWIADLMNRLHELENWVQDFRLPSSVWLGMFFNPQSFLTAIMQQTARKNGWPLDRMCLNCDVTKRMKEDITTPPREGAYVNGLFMEGARWDSKMGTIADAFIKDLYPMMPVIYIKAVTQDKQDVKNVYECPVYKIRMRGPTYVWTFNLKTKEKPSKWTLAGVCLLLQP